MLSNHSKENQCWFAFSFFPSTNSVRPVSTTVNRRDQSQRVKQSSEQAERLSYTSIAAVAGGCLGYAIATIVAPHIMLSASPAISLP